MIGKIADNFIDLQFVWKNYPPFFSSLFYFSITYVQSQIVHSHHMFLLVIIATSAIALNEDSNNNFNKWRKNIA